MSGLEMGVVSVITLGRLAALVLFIIMIVKPDRFNTRMKVAIAIFAFLALLPVPVRRLLRP